MLSPELFDEEPAAVDHEGHRLILRCNPATRERDRQRRLSQYQRIEQRLATGNQRLAQKPRTKVETLREQAQGWIDHYGPRFSSEIKPEGACKIPLRGEGKIRQSVRKNPISALPVLGVELESMVTADCPMLVGFCRFSLAMRPHQGPRN